MCSLHRLRLSLVAALVLATAVFQAMVYQAIVK